VVTQNIITPCPAPSDLAVSNVTTNTAALVWASTSGGTGFTVKAVAAGTGVNGTALGTSTVNASNSTAVLSGLSALTNYDVYVLMNCTSINSTWAGPVSFTTLCNPVNLPMSQSFTGNANTLPTCWTKQDANADSYAWAIDASGRMRLAASPASSMNDWIFSGGVNLTAGGFL